MKNIIMILISIAISYFFYNENKMNMELRESQSNTQELKYSKEPNPDDTFEIRAKLHSLFHANIFNLLNNMIVHNIRSQEVKDSYIAVIKANIGLLNINRGYEHNFFNGTLSKSIATQFLEDLVNLYTKFILDENMAFTNLDIEIFKYMVDNHTIIIKEYHRMQKKKFKKYQIVYEKEPRKVDNFQYNIIRVDGLKLLEGDIEKEDQHNTDVVTNKEIRDINIHMTRP